MALRIVRPDTAFALSSGSRKRPRRHMDDHLRWIRTLPSVVSGKRTRIEAAHIRYGDLRYGKRETGMAEKPSDHWVLPLTSEEHADQHRTGDERAWWVSKGIDPITLANALYAVTGDDEAAEQIIRAARPKMERRP